MNENIPAPETLPADAELFKRRHYRHTHARKINGNIGWLRDRRFPRTDYYWSEGDQLWKRVKPNLKPKHRSSFHRGISTSHVHIATLVGATVLHEGPEGNIGITDNAAPYEPPEEHEVSGSPKWQSGNGD